MTLSEFEMHRPKLARSLKDFAGSLSVASVLPEYDDQELFSALLEAHDGSTTIAVCVSPTHPMAFAEEECPGEPTWWWESDLQAG